MKSIFYFIFIPLLAIILASCSSKPTKDDGQFVTTSKEEDYQRANMQRLLELEQDAIHYKKQLDWVSYVSTATELWSNLEQKEQIVIEYDIWQTIKKIPKQQREELISDYPEEVNLINWLEFVEITEKKLLEQKQQLQDNLIFNPLSDFNKNLTTALISKLTTPYQIKKVAVLLPFSGNYRQVSLQIRNGIIKNRLENHPDLTLSFYDSSNAEQIVETYQTALKEGAEFIIGPIKKETIQALNSAEQITINPKTILTLNESSLPNFTYSSSTEGQQITQKLCSKEYQNVGILTSNKKLDSELALQIANQWQQLTGDSVILKSYPQKRPNLRKALGSLINSDKSAARKNNLRWLLKQDLSFTHRTRQDLDAIVLLGNTKQLAVFQPQFKFFNLKLPVYGSAKITPAKLFNSKANKDLKNIHFPSYPAALYPSSLTSKLEAFGWDSFLIATQQHLFSPNICLNTGMTGKLNRDGLIYDHQYIWAKYNRQGFVE